MSLLLLASVALALSLVLFGMAMRHKTLLDEGVLRKMQERLAKLTST